MKNVLCSHTDINESQCSIFFRIFPGRYGSELFVIQAPKNNNESVQNKENHCPKNNRIAAELLIMDCEQFEVPHTRCVSSLFFVILLSIFWEEKKAIFLCYRLPLVRGTVGGGVPVRQPPIQFWPAWHINTNDGLSFVDKTVPKNAYISPLIPPPHSPHAFFDRSHECAVSEMNTMCMCIAYVLYMCGFGCLALRHQQNVLGTPRINNHFPWHFPISFSFDAKITHYFRFLSCNNTHESCFGGETTANGGNGIEFNGHMLMSFNWSKFVAYILHDLTISWTVEPNNHNEYPDSIYGHQNMLSMNVDWLCWMC